MLLMSSSRRVKHAEVVGSGWRPLLARSTAVRARGPIPIATNSGCTTAGTSPASERDRTFLGTLRKLGVLREEPRGVARLGQLPIGLAPLDRRRVDQEVEAQAGHVDSNAVAILDEGDGSAVDGLWRHVADAEPPRAAAEATVGDEGAIVTTAHPLECAGDRQHLAHAGPALGTLVADHDDRARLDRPAEDGLHGR